MIQIISEIVFLLLAISILLYSSYMLIKILGENDE